jgi:hypothetical protein
MEEKSRLTNWSNVWRECLFFTLVGGFLLLSLANFQGKRLDSPVAAPTVTAQLPTDPYSPRAPASLPLESRSTYALVLGCLENESLQSLKTSASLLQIQWQKCKVGSAGKAPAAQAKNQTTGESLLLLENDANYFTHYFPLSPGKNEIHILSGKTPKTIEVIRN